MWSAALGKERFHGLKLDSKLRIGVITIHRRTEPAAGPWQPSIDEMRELVELVDRSGYDSLWCGDHISFPAAILDPLLQLAQAAVVSRRLIPRHVGLPLAVASSGARRQAGGDTRPPQ